MSGIRIEMFSTKRIWRFVLTWNKEKLEVWWLQDKQYNAFWGEYRYTTQKPLIKMHW